MLRQAVLSARLWGASFARRSAFARAKFASDPTRLRSAVAQLHSQVVRKVAARTTPSAAGQRRELSFLARRQLRSLEAQANAAPHDSEAQCAYLEMLLKHYPEEVVKRVESGLFAQSGEVQAVYLEALARIGRLDAHGYQRLLASGARSGNARAVMEEGGEGVATPILRLDPKAGPLRVHVESIAGAAQRTKYDFMMNAIRWTFIGIILFSIIGTFVSEERVGGGGPAGRLGQIINRDVVHQASETDTTFADVRGMENEIRELEEIVEYLKNPDRFTSMGAKLPKGVLLAGPPGTGKTLLGRAVAGEAGVPFFFASGSEFEEMFVGVGARRMRDLFAAAKKSAPCIVFIDEIDAVGGRRGSHDSMSVRQTINQLLTLMDGFEQNSGIVVMAATNAPDMLDSALVRPGRFDKHITVERPDRKAREEILWLYLSKVPHDPDAVDVEGLARTMIGATGADLANLVNTAALRASMQRKQVVKQEELEWALDRIVLGNDRRDIRTPEEMRLTAYHEGGHALIAMLTEGAGPIHKATILPRGKALGVVVRQQTKEASQSRKELVASMDVAMGGRVAEELTVGADNVTTGATSDMQYATRLATALVEQYSMSDLGVAYVDDRKRLSPEMQAKLDTEVKKLLDGSYDRARRLLGGNRDKLKLVAEALLEHETLSGEELLMVLKGAKLPPKHASRGGGKGEDTSVTKDGKVAGGLGAYAS